MTSHHLFGVPRLPSSFKSRAMARWVAAALVPVLPALGAAALLGAAPMAWADGGAGGGGAMGGTGTTGAAGMASFDATGGGGGASGDATGGAGGASGTSTGGAGGSGAGADGQAGVSDYSGMNGGGGGGGGTHGAVVGSLSNAASLAGGSGGAGGNVRVPNITTLNRLGGGGGGAGGHGAAASGLANTNSGGIVGGNGGRAGQAMLSGYVFSTPNAVYIGTAEGGSGGSGGTGVALSSDGAQLLNAAVATVRGGAGGDSSSIAIFQIFNAGNSVTSVQANSRARSGTGATGIEADGMRSGVQNEGIVSGGASGSASAVAYVQLYGVDGDVVSNAIAASADGGAGVRFNGSGGSLTQAVTGSIVGGAAGSASASGQSFMNSNTGIQPAGQTTLEQAATGGRGGDGVRFESGGASLVNAGNIVGGSGGLASARSYRSNGSADGPQSAVAQGGQGGDGVHLVSDGIVVNSGTITGGAAGGAEGYVYSDHVLASTLNPTMPVARTLAGNGGAGLDMASGRVENQAIGLISGGAATQSFVSQLIGPFSGDSATLTSGGSAGTGLLQRSGNATNAGLISGGAVQQSSRFYDQLEVGSQQVDSGTTVDLLHARAAAGATGGAGVTMLGGNLVNDAAGAIRGGDIMSASTLQVEAYFYGYAAINGTSTVLTSGAMNSTLSGGSAGRGAEVSGTGLLHNNGTIAGGRAAGQVRISSQVEGHLSNAGSDNQTVAAMRSVVNASSGGDGIAARGTSVVTNTGSVSGGDTANTIQANLSLSHYDSLNGGGVNNTLSASGTQALAGGAGGAGVVLADAATLTNAGVVRGGRSADTFSLAMVTQNGSSSVTGTFNAAVQGGAGGAGAVLGGGTLINTGTVTGGQGGNVDLAGLSVQDGFGGALALSVKAGAGGAAVQFTGNGASSVYNAAGGSLLGGNGGVLASAVTGNVTPTGLLAGAGGAGVSGTNVTVTNAGTIQGGLGAGGVRAAPIEFTGGINKLTIEATSNILGNVQAFSRADTFGLGGATDASFDIARIGDTAQFRGFGAFEKTGTSQWTLTGSSAQTVDFLVRGGRLANNASMPNTDVTVGRGATLAGNGTVGGLTAQAGSTVAPGNSIGTLTVNGNYTAAAGSIYQVEYDGIASDLIQASGTATLAAGAGLQAIHYGTTPVPLNVRYTVVQAAGGVTGKYTLSGETVASPFVTLHDTYDATHVYLEAEQSAPLVPVAAASPDVTPARIAGYTTNQINTGSAAQSLAITNGLRQALLYQPTVAAARAGFDQISGESHASVKTALLEDSRFVREAANDRLLGAFCAPGATTLATMAGATPTGPNRCLSVGGTRAWGKIFGSTGRMKGDGNAQQADRDIGGVVVGADAAVGDGWRVGGLAAYSRSDMDHMRSASDKTDDYTLSAYGGQHWNDTSLRLGASHTWHQLDTRRSVAFTGFADSLAAKYDGSTSQVFGELGQRVDLGRAALEPFAGLAYVRVKTDAFAERGGLSALSGRSPSNDVTFGTLGVRAAAELTEGVRLRGTVGWRHAFSRVTPSSTNAFAGGAAFAVYGVPLAKDVGIIEAGIETTLRPRLTLGASYGGQFGSGLRDNGFKVALGLTF